jgi:hypothetical protein
MTTTTTSTERPALTRARAAAAAAAALLGVNGALGLLGDVNDHTTGLGMLSEVSAGLAFLAGAIALAVLTPVTGWRGVLWWLAPVGLTIAGATMVGVPVFGSEPVEWLFVVAVLPTFVGLVAAGILGSRRLWPWWTGAGLALFLPVMFTLPWNSFWMAAVWMAVAVTAAPRPGAASRLPSTA